MEKVKTRGLSISGKLTIWIAIFSTLVCLCLGGAIYYRVYRYFEDIMRTQATDIAAIAANQIDTEELSKIKVGMEESWEFKDVVLNLQSVLESEHVEYVYIMRMNDQGALEFWVDADTEEPALIGEPYEEVSDAMITALRGERAADKETSQDEWGTYLSGYAPVIDENGNVLGIVGVDISIGFVRENMSALMMTIFAIAVCGVAFICLGNGIIVKNITSNIKQIIQKIDDVVHSDGDLTKELKFSSGDEMEVIANLLNEFLRQLRQILGETQRLSMQVSNVSRDTSNKLSESQNGVVSVSDAMQELGTMMNDTTAAMEKIQEATIQISETAEEMVSFSKEGSTYMSSAGSRARKVQEGAQSTQKETVDIAGKITAEVTERINQAKQVEAIADLSQTIIDISRESNLLAINAAIEAARAGESGKGFAVVADEISSLATTSKNAAEEIGKVCDTAIASVNGLADAAKQIIDFLSHKVYGDYNGFVENSRQYSEDAIKINEYMEQFRQKSEELNSAVRMTQEAIGNISAAMQEGNASVLTVADTSLKLKEGMQEVMNVTIENGNEISKLENSIERFRI